MFKGLVFVFSLLILSFFLGTGEVRADCSLNKTTGWWSCRDASGNITQATCQDVKCGAGTGCIGGRCYDCASQKNCDLASCPAGWSWNDCATGQNTCKDQTVLDACPPPGNPCATKSPIVPAGPCNQKVGSDVVCDSYSATVCNPVTITEDRDCHDVWNLTCDRYAYVCYGRDRRGNCISEWGYQCVSSHWEKSTACTQYSYTQNRCSGGNCVHYSTVDRYVDTCPGATTGGTCQSTCVAGYVTKTCATGSNTCKGGCFPPPCNPDNWGSCSATCGGGLETNECGGTRPCNTQSCCTATQPNVNLVSPIGSSIPGPSVPLVWNVLDYGTGCPQNNSSTVYVKECPDPQGVWGLPADWMKPANVVTNYSPYVGQIGKSYCWTVVINNGSQSWYPVPKRWSFIDRPWWQVKGGGIMAGGDITSKVATGQKLIKDDNGVVAANGTLSLNNTSNTWQASNDPNIISSKLNYRYDYDSVYSRVYAHIRPIEKDDWDLYNSLIPTGANYNYVHVTGDLNTREDLNIGSNKLVILVEGDANLNYKINFDDNVGLFALYVKGNINIDPQVGTGTVTGTDPETLTADLEGIFLASGSINTGVSQKQLKIEGPVIGISGVNFQRNLYSQWPSEYIVFRPDILMNLPKPLLRQNNLWMEANP